MEELNEEISKLRKEYPEGNDQELLSDLSKSAKLHSLFINMKSHPAMRIILAKYERDIATINKTLSTDKTLLETPIGQLKGLTLHARKDWCEELLSFFKRADVGFKNAQASVDSFKQNKT